MFIGIGFAFSCGNPGGGMSSGPAVGLAAGLASVVGVGSPGPAGAAAGVATATAVGASLHEAAGASSGVAVVSGVGASSGVTIPIFAHHYKQQRDVQVQYLKQSTASQAVLLGPFVDDTDGVTAETALTIANTDIRLSKNGGNMAAKNSGGGTHDENGWYTITLDATDTDTVGRLQISCVVAGALPVHMEFQVVEEAIYDDVLASGADAVHDANLVSIAGDTGDATKLGKAAKGAITGTCASGGTTTSVVASSTDPVSGENDQFNGRTLTFADDTTTTNLRGQSCEITDYVHSTTTFTVTTLTEAPASGDTFIIQ